MDALAAIIFVAFVATVFIVVGYAMLTIAGGWHGGEQFYIDMVKRLMGMYLFMNLFGTFPLLGLVFWQLFTASTSPYPMLATCPSRGSNPRLKPATCY